MTIEDTLSSIDTSLKTIVTILQSAGAMVTAEFAPSDIAAAATPGDAGTTTRKRRTKAEIAADEAAAAAGKTSPALGLVDGDPEGTRYWVSDELQTAYAQKPGDPDPQPQSFKLTSAADYLEKKATFAAKKDQTVAQPVTTSAAPAATEPSATAPAATASAATSAAEPTWKEVLASLQDVNKSTKAGHGRDGILALLKQFGCEGKTVPALEPLGKHSAILAAARALLDGEAAVIDDLGLGL
jgi:hypothetical protein